MVKLKVLATTAKRRKALSAATEAGDAKAIAAYQPWEEVIDVPADYAEMAKAWKPEDIFDRAMRQFKTDQQGVIRSKHEPQSPAARKRNVFEAFLKKQGKTIDQLEKELGITG